MQTLGQKESTVGKLCWHVHHDELVEYDEAWAEYDEAREKYAEVREKCDVLWADGALLKHMPGLVRLHKEQCPNCPWDGKTIFPPVKK